MGVGENKKVCKSNFIFFQIPKIDGSRIRKMNNKKPWPYIAIGVKTPTLLVSNIFRTLKMLNFIAAKLNWFTVYALIVLTNIKSLIVNPAT